MAVAVRARGAVGAVVAVLAMAGCGSSSDTSGDRDAISPATETSKEADSDEKQREAVNGEEGKSILEGEARSCASADPLDPTEAEALLPKGIRLPDEATYLSVKQDPTYVTITASVEGTTPTKLKDRYLTEVPAAGYKVGRQDDEGFEAEVFFELAANRPGTLQFVKSACPPGSVRIVVSYLKVASTTTSP